MESNQQPCQMLHVLGTTLASPMDTCYLAEFQDETDKLSHSKWVFCEYHGRWKFSGRVCCTLDFFFLVFFLRECRPLPKALEFIMWQCHNLTLKQ
jgi:hypothetical protein